MCRRRKPRSRRSRSSTLRSAGASNPRMEAMFPLLHGRDRRECRRAQDQPRGSGPVRAQSQQRRWSAATKRESSPTRSCPFTQGRRRQRDEHPRPDTTLENLAKLKPAFCDDGTVTAGNSSGINDGAAALVVEAGRPNRSVFEPIGLHRSERGRRRRSRVMGIGPVPAIRKALLRAGSTPDLDLFELNEAFAAQALACRELGLDNA